MAEKWRPMPDCAPRDWLAYQVCVHTPLDRHWRQAFLWLLPYAGLWAYRHYDSKEPASTAEGQSDGE